jgi:hypothetical protein
VISYHRWVRIPEVENHLRMGWFPLRSLEGTRHGDWSVHMKWLCDCPVPGADFTLPNSASHALPSQTAA